MKGDAGKQDRSVCTAKSRAGESGERWTHRMLRLSGSAAGWSYIPTGTSLRLCL
ncbi:hypothetical protein PO124_03970 [Bacillus licheniformis]|nr:hypothetical protein [Bacillus licheniformis]